MALPAFMNFSVYSRSVFRHPLRYGAYISISCLITHNYGKDFVMIIDKLL